MGQLKDKNGNNYNPITTTNDVTDGNQTLEERLQSIEQGAGGDSAYEKVGAKQEGKGIYSNNVGEKVSLSSNANYNVYIYDVVENEIVTIKGSHAGSGAVTVYCFVDALGTILKKPSFAYTSAIQTFPDVVAPKGSAYLYVNEYFSQNGASSKAITTKLDGMALAPYRNIIRDRGKFTAEQAQKYYELGSQKMDTYNLVREKVGIITIGQSNIDGRIAAADFPATANINGTDISLAKSIPTCKYMRGTADSATYDEATRSFAAYNNTGAWSFDQVVYNAIANALGSETDFYVCKQSRGGTSIGYAQYTSFCADIDDFKFYNGRDWSQLYHLKCLVKRALELQPDLKFKAIIMHQGEQDENIVKTSGTYYINLCRLIQWIRGLVGSPKLPFIFGSIPTNSSSFNQIIYDDMVRVAADLNDVYLVTMGEATDWVDDQWHSGTTGLHFGANTAVKLADDMYQLMVSRKMLAPYV